MARRLALRALNPDEERLLAAKLADKQLPAKQHERYRIVALVRAGYTAASAARAVDCSEGKAAHWVKRLNESGFTTFEHEPNHPGRPPLIDGEQVHALIRVALSRPEDLGLPFTQWSVAKLRAYCLKEGLIPPISGEWVRRLLRREGISYQHSKTWKQSPDPAFEAKKTASSTSMPPRQMVGRSSASMSVAPWS